MTTSVINLATLTPAQGFVFNGIVRNDRSGVSVASAGDVNGDGIDDLIIGAFNADPGGRFNVGESYVVFGKAGGFDTSLDLSNLNGANGFVLNGIDPGDFSGRSVASAGDVNGDGIDDLIIGAYLADPGGRRDAGESYVVFGSRTGFGTSLNLSSLNGTNGFVLNGIDSYDYSGTSVASAGDVNGDGIDDLIIGASYADPGGRGNAGESYVVFGSRTGFAASLDLSSLNGANGFVISGIDAYDRSGTSVASAGDVNGDGVDDLIIGVLFADPGGRSGAGESYVVFGKSGGFGPSLNLSSLDGTNGFILNGIDALDYSGRSVASAGDVNGDGIDDLIIGAFGANGFTGESYVVFGRDSTAGARFGASLDLSSLDGTTGFVINGIDAGDQTGVSVASAGDVTGDGIDDLVIGVFGANSLAGKSYVVFGKTGGFGPSLDLSSLNGTNGFVLNGIDVNDFSGRSVASAGDVNGDGIDDLIIGALYADPEGRANAGESYVVFGFRPDAPLGAVGDANTAADSVAENVAIGTTVGLTARAIDPDAGDTVSYSLTDNAGGRFAINANTGVVTVARALDFESATSHQITIQATSSGGSSQTANFIIAVSNVDDPLGAVSDTNTAANSVAENAAIGTLVGVTARAIDPDAGDTVTYSLTDNAGGRFAINANTGVVTVAGALDFETATHHGITVRATSSGGGSQTLAFDILVSDVIERLAITGTAAKNRLIGTQADEVFTGGAGNDVMTGRGGSDLFVFGTETANGLRETDQISDFGLGDLLDLGGASIVREINSGGSTRLIVGDDRDVILLTGLADFDADTMLLV